MFREQRGGPEYENPINTAVETAVGTFLKLPETALEAGKKGINFLRRLVVGESK